LAARSSACAREDLVLRRLEPAPHGFALGGRRQRHFLPAVLQPPHPAGGRFGILLVLERLHLATQLLLHLEVRPPLPLVGFAQLLNLRSELRARHFKARLDVLPVLFGWKRGTMFERGSDVSQGASSCFQRDLLRSSQRLRMATQLLETPEMVLTLLGAYRGLLVLPLL
jgi:hypothetical protein